MGHSDAYEKLKQHVRKHCNEYGIKLIEGNGLNINYEGRCSGVFDSENAIIKIAKNNKYKLSVLVHEYCHFLQFIENKNWDCDGTDPSIILSDYLKGVNFSSDLLENARKQIILMERDCDIRSVNMIKKWKLPININLYIKQSNAYAYSYFYTFEKRKWLGNIWKNKKILDIMPSHFRCRTWEFIPVGIKKEFENAFRCQYNRPRSRNSG